MLFIRKERKRNEQTAEGVTQKNDEINSINSSWCLFNWQSHENRNKLCVFHQNIQSKVFSLSLSLFLDTSSHPMWINRRFLKREMQKKKINIFLTYGKIANSSIYTKTLPVNIYISWISREHFLDDKFR